MALTRGLSAYSAAAAAVGVMTVFAPPFHRPVGIWCMTAGDSERQTDSLTIMTGWMGVAPEARASV